MINLIKINTLTKSPIIIALIWMCLSVACSSDSHQDKQSEVKSPRIRKQVDLINPQGSSTLKLGEPALFQIAHRENIRIDSAFLEVGKMSIRFKNDSATFTNSETVGKPDFKITAYFQGQVETLYPSITYLSPSAPELRSYQIIKRYPHDQSAYTQGLFFIENQLYESTGQNGSSSLRKVNLNTGEVNQIMNLDDKYFGEGSTYVNDKIYLLTWTSQVCFVYNTDFELQTQFNYTTQGWGLTNDGSHLYMSDGTEKIYVIRPDDFSISRTLQVYDDKGKVTQLNELEWVENQLYANIYGEDRIAIIDPESGMVLAYVDCRGLVDRSVYKGYDYAFNGIASNAAGKLYVTGKLWPELFEIQIKSTNNPL